MNQLERLFDMEEAVRQQIRAQLLDLQTSMPVIVQEYDDKKLVVVAQPTTRAIITARDGSTSWMQLPLLINMPVVFPGGGGYTFTFPIKPGDEGIAIFSSRCIDAWWVAGGVQNQIEFRQHDLSDGFYLPGVRSLARMLRDVNTEGPELRSDDGLVSVGLGDAGVTIKVPLTKVVTIDGNLHVNGSITHTP